MRENIPIDLYRKLWSGERLKKSQWIVGLIVLAAMVAIGVYAQHRYAFNWDKVFAQLASADWRRIAVAVACIYVAYVFRAVRWSLLMRHNKKVPLFSLLGTQVMGFTAVALIGRVRRPGAALPRRQENRASRSGSQIAVYIVERLFDFGTMALIASLALLWIPQPALAAASGHSGFFSHFFAPLVHRFPILAVVFARFGALLITVAGVLLLVAVRLSGGAVARLFEVSFGLISKSLGHAVGHKIRTFHAGLDVIHNFADFGYSASLSLGMWLLITLRLH